MPYRQLSLASASRGACSGYGRTRSGRGAIFGGRQIVHSAATASQARCLVPPKIPTCVMAFPQCDRTAVMHHQPYGSVFESRWSNAHWPILRVGGSRPNGVDETPNETLRLNPMRIITPAYHCFSPSCLVFGFVTAPQRHGNVPKADVSEFSFVSSLLCLFLPCHTTAASHHQHLKHTPHHQTRSVPFRILTLAE